MELRHYATWQVIPQAPDVLLEYEGTLAVDKWISLVDSSLNGENSPCAVGAIAAASQDNYHSGPLQGKGSSSGSTACCAGSGRIVKVPQAQLLDASKTYAVCYTTADGLASDTWIDSTIRIMVSKLEIVTAYGVKHKRAGTIPNHPSLTMRYTGTLLNDRWISFVDASLNLGRPCEDGTVAAAAKDASHSGSIASAVHTIIVDTAALSTAVFAVCYAGDITLDCVLLR